MHVVLMTIGILVSAIGLVALGLGVWINEFSLGNTLIIAGTTGLSGGLILIGLAAAVRQLIRIAEALARPMPRPQQRPAEGHEAMVAPGARPAAPRPPFPPKPPSREAIAGVPPADMRPAEPRPLGAPPAAAEERPRVSPLTSAAPAEVDEAVPLSPQGAVPVPPPAAPVMPPPSRESPSVRPDPERAVGSATVDVLRGPRLEPPWRPTLPAERDIAAAPERSTRGLFDSLWPIEGGRRSAEPRKSERGPFEPRERRGDDRPAVTDLGVAAFGDALAKDIVPAPESTHARDPEPAAAEPPPGGPVEASEPEPAAMRSEPEPAEPEPAEPEPAEPTRVGAEAGPEESAAPRPESGAAPRLEEPGAAPRLEPGAAPTLPEDADERRTVSILKSGVVDGMAYTLYSDGSIEAELPEGTIRFTSIEDLRRHLDTHS